MRECPTRALICAPALLSSAVTVAIGAAGGDAFVVSGDGSNLADDTLLKVLNNGELVLATDSTLARWERGEREPTGAFLGRVKRFVEDGTASGKRRAG